MENTDPALLRIDEWATLNETDPAQAARRRVLEAELASLGTTVGDLYAMAINRMGFDAVQAPAEGLIGEWDRRMEHSGFRHILRRSS